MKYPENNNIPVVIIGGGPVGLFMAIILLKNGIKCKVLEKREEPVPGSRSLGIHPPSLTLFDNLGIAKPFLKAGVKIKKGIASTGTIKLGEVDFNVLPKPFNFILACPQFETEKILRNIAHHLDPDCLVTNSEFLNFTQDESSVELSFRDQENQIREIKCKFLIGCDGKNSAVRKEASIHFSGKRYPDTYIMGDFEDTTDFRDDAVVFLPAEGLIESFPLPNGKRRWVVKTEDYISKPETDDLSGLIKKRIGFELSGVSRDMLSSFGVQYFMAESFVKNRVILVGDAAHVVSPIGGQGMNLGWLGARNLGNLLIENRSSWGTNSGNINFVHKYGITHKKAVHKSARRAEINMYLGRTYVLPELRNVLVRVMLSRFFNQKTAKMFTMQNLESFSYK